MVSFLLLLIYLFSPVKQLPLTSLGLAQPENGSGGKGLLYTVCAVVVWGWVPLDFVHMWLLVLSLLQLWLSSLRLPGCGHARWK